MVHVQPDEGRFLQIDHRAAAELAGDDREVGVVADEHEPGRAGVFFHQRLELAHPEAAGEAVVHDEAIFDSEGFRERSRRCGSLVDRGW